MSLRGHGRSTGREDLNTHSQDDYVDDVIRIAEDFATPPLVVGHSMGGMIAQLALSRAPKKFSGQVLVASMPPDGLTLFELTSILLRCRGLKLTRRVMTGRGVHPDEIQSLLFFNGGLADADIHWVHDNLQAESSRAIKALAKTRIVRPIVPPASLVVGSGKDLLFGSSVLKRTARFYNADLHIHPVGCHDLMLDRQSEAVAMQIIDWGIKRKLVDAFAAQP